MADETRKDSAAAGEAVIVSAAVGDEHGVQAAGAIAIEGDNAIIVASFADMNTAREAYDALRKAESEGGIAIDGVLVVNADESGKIHVQKMTDHTTRTGFAWGAVAGVVLGVIFPPSILASAATLGVAGAAIGKVGNVIKKGEVADALTTVLAPGTSGILALVDISAVEAVKQELPEAKAVETVPVSAEAADAIKEASKSVEPAPAGA